MYGHRAPKCHPECPKTSPGEPKTSQNDPKIAQHDPKRGQKRPKTTPRGAQKDEKSESTPQDKKRSEPRRSWDRLGPPRCRFAHYRCAPRSPFGRPKRHQNRSQNDQKSKRKIKRQKNRSKTILDPSWGDLGPSWVPSWADLDPKIVLSPRAALVFLKNHLFDVKTVRRRLWDQLWPTKAPK